MSADLATTPTRLAVSLRHAYGDGHVRVGLRGRVHLVAWERDSLGTEHPVPACGQAFGGHEGELRPTRWPVTCLRCRRASGEDVDHPDPLQPSLW